MHESQRGHRFSIGEGGLADDWIRAAQSSCQKGKVSRASSSPNRAVGDSSEVLCGWYASVESPPITERGRIANNSNRPARDGREELRLPPVHINNGQERKNKSMKDNKVQPTYEVCL